MRSFFIAWCTLLLAGCLNARPKLWSVPQAADDTVRQTTSGPVVGGPGHFGSHVWLGIPFAAPPVGELRWQPPRPPVSWQSPRQVLTYGAMCPQLPSGIGGDTGAVRGDEDCLTLNVFAPAFAPTTVPKAEQRLPVMVWIHGGGNSMGSANTYDGAHLATSQQVLVVTTQYRLGPLGWFAHDALEQASGNFGTLDLVAALQWVHDNAEAFGGDPGNVTIFGESAGGFDVFTLLLAPQAKGLFHRAIAQSGLLLHETPAHAQNWADGPAPGHHNSSNEVAARLLVRDGTAKDRAAAQAMLGAMGRPALAAYLRSKSPAELIASYEGGRGLGMLDAPLLLADGVVLPTGDWLEHFARADGWNQVPVMLGTNKEEMKLFLFLDPNRVHWRFGLLPRAVDEGLYELAASAGSRFWKLNGADLPAAAMVRSGQPDIYGYRFDWRDQKTTFGTDLGKMVGAAHSIEIPFVFGDFGGPMARLFETDQPEARERLSTQMMSYWGQFAHHGRPGRGAGDLPEWAPWSEASPDAARYLVLDTPARGGLRMSNQTETLERIVADVKSDARLTTPKARCTMLHDFAALSRVDARATYARVASDVCGAFAYDAYPWVDAK